MPSTDQPLNVLLITSDQQHFSTLGVVNPKIHTPSLDALARQGTRFDRAYCANPVCSPSRSTILTGLYPAWHGCWTIGVKLPEDVPTLGELLRPRGYDSTLIGKAHFQPLASRPDQESIECQPKLRDLDFWRGFHGPWYGFSHVETARMHADESHVGQHYALWMEERGLKNWRDYFKPWPEKPGTADADAAYRFAGRKRAWKLPAELHYSTWTAERTIARIERCAQRKQPFFLWSSFHDPHPPYLAPEPWASMYDPRDMEPGTLDPREMALLPIHFRKTQEANPDYSRWQETQYWNHGFHSHLGDREELKKDMAIYFGMVSFMDQQIGRVLKRLDELDIADNTVVVFTSDHGHFVGHHGLTAKGPFHFEDLVRVPFIVRHPRQTNRGGVSRCIQSLVDFAPTALASAGIKPPGAMQGVDQTATWTGGTTPARDHAIVENRHQPTALHLRTYVDNRYKLTIYRNQTDGELFDLVQDPGEVRNLWNDPEHASVKGHVMREFMNAELVREPTRLERIAGA